ncbi:MAG: transglycosylase domain-containing protein [Clostridia bacterium]|nr:transglycosylase domain-containing protein [Clostridia bacterium]
MKKAFKIVLFILGSIFILFSGITSYFFIATSNVKLDDKKLVNLDRTITFYDDAGEVFFLQSNGQNVVDSKDIPSHTKNAFIAIEDKRFYSHSGIDMKRLVGATIKNVKSMSIKEGGSTITQQLIKNTHLSSEKTLKRKLNEIRLALKLEKKYSKDEILEKYLNTIYFGDNCYGISEASKHYFDKTPSELTVNESAILASIIKSPATYSPKRNEQKCFNRKNVVLKAMFEQGYIDKNTFEKCKNEPLKIKDGGGYHYDISHFFIDETSKLIENSPYDNSDLKIYTSINKFAQEIVENAIENIKIDCDKSAVLINKNGKIVAYSSNCPDSPRQLGSAFKPLSVYAPAIEKDVINSFTIINDEKVDFNGYSPSNYNNRYYGDLSVKESLEKSSNTISVKILNSLGTKYSINYLQKLNFDVKDSDANLSLALGSTYNGDKLSTLTAGYGVFINGGNYIKPSAINKMVVNNRRTINITQPKTQVFSSDTAYIVADMLKGVVDNGTAKKLSSLPFSVYAKTGTVGDKNGNSDAYCISLTSEYILGVRLSAKQNKKLDNSITGGGLPTSISKEIWENIYKDNYPKEIAMPSSVKKVLIDKISFEQDKTILLAEEIAPKRYVREVLCKEKSLPNVISTRFSSPKIEKPKLSINNKQICISLCVVEYYDVIILRENEQMEIEVYNTKNNDRTYFVDSAILPDKIYSYYAIPYFIDNHGNKRFGEKIFIETIKAPRINLDAWWDD